MLSARLVSIGIIKLSGLSPRLKVMIPIMKLMKAIIGITIRFVNKTV